MNILLFFRINNVNSNNALNIGKISNYFFHNFHHRKFNQFNKFFQSINFFRPFQFLINFLINLNKFNQFKFNPLKM